MRVIAETVEPENCKDCIYIMTGNLEGSEDRVYVCPMVGFEEVSGEGIDDRCPWEHLDDETIADIM